MASSTLPAPGPPRAVPSGRPVKTRSTGTGSSGSLTRLVVKSIAAHRLRLLLTMFSIVLGVGFVTSSFVLSDGLRASFTTLSSSITSGVDLSVRPADGLGEPEPFADSVISELAAIPGVAAIAPDLQTDAVQPVQADGSVLLNSGPPQLGFGWVDDEQLNQFTVIDGRAPESGAEFTMDRDTADRGSFEIGQRYDVLTPSGRQNAELVGVVRFGDENATLGATLLQFPFDTAQTWLGLDGLVREVDLRLEDGADPVAVQAAVTRALPTGIEVVDQATVTDETTKDFTNAVDILGNVLLGFAIVSLFVSSFSIANTFAIVVGQRTRELALLRALGSSARQIRAMVLGEAAIVGVVSSFIGIGTGMLVTLGLRAAFNAGGFSLPDADLTVEPRTWVIALTLGIGVTVLAALRPARRASQVAPVAAMSANVTGAEQALSRRAAVIGGALVAAAVALIAVGLGTGAWLAVGAGVLALVIGALRLAPAMVSPFVKIVGQPLRMLFGHSGRLAQANARRNPRRTASTGAALMIGLAIVAGFLVVGQSLKTRLASVIDSSVVADLVVTSQSDGPMPTSVADQMLQSGQFETVGVIRSSDIEINATEYVASGADFATVDQLWDVGVSSGSFATTPSAAVPSSDRIALHDDVADELGVGLGDTVSVRLPRSEARPFEVTAVYAQDALAGPVTLDLSVWDDVTVAPVDFIVAGRFASGTPTEVQVAGAAALAAALPQVNVDTPAAYSDRLGGQVDLLLMVVNLMVVLTVIIALLGITNTLALATVERTRELGLLRAVGMSRRSVRRTVRWEAALIAGFGALLGVGIGLVLGWIGVAALPDSLGASVVVPGVSIAVMASLAVTAALLAAQFPARRAARLDVLDAISQ
jgi:putative ABC transport system permease protein